MPGPAQGLHPRWAGELPGGLLWRLPVAFSCIRQVPAEEGALKVDAAMNRPSWSYRKCIVVGGRGPHPPAPEVRGPAEESMAGWGAAISNNHRPSIQTKRHFRPAV